jgi:hypothetical protein
LITPLPARSGEQNWRYKTPSAFALQVLFESDYSYLFLRKRLLPVADKMPGSFNGLTKSAHAMAGKEKPPCNDMTACRKALLKKIYINNGEISLASFAFNY